MLDGVERYGHARHGADLPAPQPGAVDDHVGADLALVRHHARDAAGTGAEAGDTRVLDHAQAALLGALDQRRQKVGGVHAPVARAPDGAHRVLGLHDRDFLFRFARRNDVHVDAERAARGLQAVQLGHTRFGARQDHAAAFAPADMLAGLGLERLVEIARIGVVPHGVEAGHEARDVAGRMPGGAAGKLLAFDQNHVAPAALGQVIGQVRAGDTPAHDDGLGVAGQLVAHGNSPA